jgi:putative ABC transport system permease protein
LPAFNAFTEKDLKLGLHTDYRIWIGVVLTAVLVGLLSGMYPAFFQSKLKPYLLLKNKINVGKGNLSVRRVLVVFQFSLSIIMSVATMVVYQQLKYVNTADMGFNKEQLLVVDINSGRVRRSAETIKTEFSKIPGVRSVSVTSRVPGEWKIIPKVKVRMPGKFTSKGEDVYFMAVDEQFLQTFRVNLLSGRNFSSANGDSTSVILNEAAAKMLGVTQPAEQPIEVPSVAFGGNASALQNPFRARVIGIVKDFNFQSLRDKVAPMVIAYQNNPVHNIDYFTSKIVTSDIAGTLKAMEDVLRKIDGSHLFEYNFLDKQWDLFYREDEKRQTIFLGIALMTILIACLGLFGLATYAAEQRIKEIGIRKVLGASVSSIVGMLSRDFAKLVLIASLIAFPVAWWAMNNWLEDFAYRIHIQWWVFVLAGIGALCIALFTVSFQTIRAALSNPVKNLRTE